MQKITSVTALVKELANAKSAGQFATIEGEHTTKFNQFPNEDYCLANGIKLASGKGSKALNEPYRFNGTPYTYRFKVLFHFGQDYERTLAKLGLTKSENGNRNEIVHFGTIAMGYPTTHNVCLIYMEGNYSGQGYYKDNTLVTDETELAYIKGYKSVSKPTEISYRTLGVRNVRRLAYGGKVFEVEITDITPQDFDTLCSLYTKKVESTAL